MLLFSFEDILYNAVMKAQNVIKAQHVCVCDSQVWLKMDALDNYWPAK